MTLLEEIVAALYAEKERAWSQAGVTAREFLHQVVKDADPYEEYGYVVSEPRVKSQGRAVAKLSRRMEGIREEDLAGRVEELISDWVGVKLTCNTTSDAQAAIAKLKSLCESEGSYRFAQKDGCDDVVDYIDKPKASGYRAFHAVLVVPGTVKAKQCDIKVEVQIKTRLQDAWGELTHENFYKNIDGPKPTAFHTALAKTMADLLASVDSLAQQVADDIKAQEAVQLHDELVTVVRAEPRYALVAAQGGRQGLVRATSLRNFLASQNLVEPDEFIDVDEHLQEGATLWARREIGEDEKLYFDPTRLASGGPEPGAGRNR